MSEAGGGTGGTGSLSARGWGVTVSRRPSGPRSDVARRLNMSASICCCAQIQIQIQYIHIIIFMCTKNRLVCVLFLLKYAVSHFLNYPHYAI